MDSDRIKEIHLSTAYPESISVYKALLQVWNECVQTSDITEFIGKFGDKASRMVKVISGDKTFEGEVTQICWDTDQWAFLVNDEWYCQSEVYELGHSDIKL